MVITVSQAIIQKIDPCVHTNEPLCKESRFTPDHVAARFFMESRTILELVRDGRLNCIRISRKIIRFTEAQIEEFERRYSSVTPNKIDRRVSKQLPSPSKNKEEVEKSTGDSARALVKEMRSWR